MRNIDVPNRQEKQLEKKRKCQAIGADEVKPSRQTIESRTTKYLGEQVGDHLFSDAKYEFNITLSDHATNQMITNSNVSDLTHSLSVGGNLKTGLRIRV